MLVHFIVIGIGAIEQSKAVFWETSAAVMVASTKVNR